MANVCMNCGKGITFGRSSSHHRGVAGKRWKKRAQVTLRTFKPNIQKIGVMVAGKMVTMKLCTACIKRYRKDKKLGASSLTA